MSGAGTRRVGLVFFPAFDWAISDTHPEREERLLYTRDQIFEEGLLDDPNILEYNPRLATETEVERAHVILPSPRRVATASHFVAAGGAIVAGEAVVRGECDTAFALVRPPGHHAMRVVHGDRGFCIINNEAVMIERLRRMPGGPRRFVVFDTDAHHADGTQDIYYNDRDVLHVSIHQDGRTLYPGTGFPEEAGGPGAFGYTLNVPVPPHTGDEGLLYVFDELVKPVIAEFAPDLVINAAGQDNHYSDPLTNMLVTAGGYAELNHRLRPDVVVLEGGYSIEGALPYVNVGILMALAGRDFSAVREPDFDAGRLEQPPGVMVRIAEMVAKVRLIWENRDGIDKERLFGKGPFYQRQRGVYYDTEQIEEGQVEKIRLCDRCSGWRALVSEGVHSGGRATTAFIVITPHDACDECDGEAAEAFARAARTKTLDKTPFRELGSGLAVDFVVHQDLRADRVTKE